MPSDPYELIARLERISPMPADDTAELNVDRLREYEMIIREIESVVSDNRVPDSRLLHPLLASFGYGDAFGLYWGTLHLLERFPADMLRAALRQAALAGERGARRWAVYMLGRHRNREDGEVLVKALHDPEEDVRYNALMALAMIGDPAALPAMEGLFDDSVLRIRKAATKYAEQLRS